MNGTKQSLDVILGKKKIAVLSIEKDQLKWDYYPAWQLSGYPLSPYLPLQEKIESIDLQRFLNNLLPEGTAFEELLACFHLSKTNTFGLMQALGRDISGALIFSRPTQKKCNEKIFRKIPLEELEDRLDKREHFSLILWDKKPRLSVAGVQDKINVMINKKGELGFGEGTLCSTHILKFERHKLAHIALNEYVTMQLARFCGLNVANVELLHFGSHTTLLVERFDRRLNADLSISRRHIIDGCQALNLPPEYKYERNFGSGRDVAHIREGASYEKLFRFAEQCISPIKTKQQILDWALFNTLVFNYDAHGKNISFFVTRKGFALAPFYDLVNINMDPDFEQAVAMALGDCFDTHIVNAYQLADFADTCSLSRTLVSKRLKAIIEKLQKGLDGLNALNGIVKTKEEKIVLKKYQKMVRLRCKYLLAQADKIMGIAL